MSRRQIVSKTIDGFTVTELDVRIVSMPLYPSTDAVVNVFYGYYSNNKRIGAEGNLQLGDLISSSSKTSLLNALTAQIGAITEATLLLHQLTDGYFSIKYKKSDGTESRIKLTGSYFADSEYSDIISAVMTATSNEYYGLFTKTLTVNSSSSQTSYPVTVTIHNTTGTNTNTDVYLGSSVRSDWGDIRFRKSDDSYIPFGILFKTSTSILVAFSADVINGNSSFYIDYGKPAQAGDVIKFAITTDQHYDSAQTLVGRDQALTRLENWKTRMATYLPDVILEGGDKVGAITTDLTSQLGFMQSVTDKHNQLATTLGIPNYLWGWGNHDFEHAAFADVQTLYNGLLGQVAGTLYATWSDSNFTYISLDANYVPSGQTHVNNTNQGYGYINTDQLTWLTSTLSAATKPVIILVHQSLAEEDNARLTLSQAICHTQNRADVRAILESSGKVVCVLQGHFHIPLLNIINGIPYISLADLNDAPTERLTWDTPNSNSGTFNGKWSTMEIDTATKVITITQETQIDSTVNTAYQWNAPYKTIFDTGYGDNAPATFANGWQAQYNKPSILVDASDFYINNYNYIIGKLACLSDGDPTLSERTLKVIGRTNNPNYGRAEWVFASQSAAFKVSFSVRLASLATLFFKIFNSSSTTNIGPYLRFTSAGNIDANTSGGIIVIKTYSVDTWYNIQLIVNQTAKTYEVIIDGTSYGSFAYFSASTGSPLNQLEILTETGNFFIDSFRIEKYTSPIPSITAVS